MKFGDIRSKGKITRSDGTRPHILIIGGGVTGLTTAWTLSNAGCKVTVIAKQYAEPGCQNNKLVSQVAGALWEWPPAVCGSHGNDTEKQLKSLKRWSQITYVRFKNIVKEYGTDQTGIRERMSCFLFEWKLNARELQKKREIERVCHGFNNNVPELIEKYRINTDPNKKGFNIVDAYEHLSYVVDPDQYLQWLKNILVSRGVTLLHGIVEGTIQQEAPSFLKLYQADILINCTGLSSRELCEDKQLKPLRGILIHVKNDGKRFKKIESCISISQREPEPNATIQEKLKAKEGRFEFIVPRNDKILILGGYAHMGEENHHWDEMKHRYLQKMREGCVNLYPDLNQAELASYCYNVGIRPFREEPRVGQDTKDPRIFHNYGHGGSGYSLSYGCALDICKLIGLYFAREYRPHSNF